MSGRKNVAVTGVLTLHMLGMLGCGDSGGSTSTGGGGTKSALYHARVLECWWQDQNGTNLERYCITTGLCTVTPEMLCSYNVFNNETAFHAFLPDPQDGEGYAEWAEWCDESCPSDINGSPVAGKLSYPSCGAVEPVPYPYKGVCLVDEEEPTPTTGDDEGGSSESGDETGDTDGPNIETWICSEVADANCQTRSNLDPACWAEVTMPPSSQCVSAATSAEALAACQCLCGSFSDVATDGCSGSCTVLQPADCVLEELGEGPVPTFASSHVCIPANAVPSEQIVDGSLQCLNSNLFDASISLVLNNGASTAVTGLVGSLVYTTSGCVSGVCDFSLNSLTIPFRDITGVYILGSSPPTTGTYSIDGMHIQMIGSLTGSWYQSLNSITFPADTFWAEGTMSAITLDSQVLPHSALTFGTSRVMGTLSSAAPLTLDFAFEVPGGTAFVSLSVR